MTELEKKIKHYADAYYSGKEEISDAEYDELIAELRAENPESELLDTVTGEEEQIEGFPKISHNLVTGTLRKCRNVEEFSEWFSKHNFGQFSVQYKLDGNSILLEYNKGVLIRVSTRGDGFTGYDITSNGLKFQNVPHIIDASFTGSIRGEVLLFHDDFKKYYGDMKNCRNAAAGIVKHLDGSGCERLRMICYDIYDENGNVDSTETAKISFLKANGFAVPEWMTTYNFDDIIKFREEAYKLRESGGLQYDIDGIVIKQEKCDKEDLKRKCPLNNCAIKFELAEADTVLRKIVWQLHGNIFSPVGIFDPVELNGTTVSRATLCNINKMEELGVQVGKKCVLIKAGEIIPRLIKVY
jgi:DNA ligase (NAD+)